MQVQDAVGDVRAVVDIVGRDAELAAVAAFLEDEGARALLLAGEAGIGKTTLLRAALTDVRATLLRCRPAGSEVRLSFAALADLLEDVPDDLVELPEPQRAALDVALLRQVPPPGGVDGRAVGAAVLATLRAVAAREPLVVAIDDLQWLDAASAQALAFALRRLESEQVAVLATERVEPEARSALDVAALGLPLTRVEVGPLSLGALQRALRRTLDFRPPRPLLQRLHAASGGNPFFALELARALLREGTPLRAGDPLPATPSAAAALRERLGTLPQETHEALLDLAASGGRLAPREDALAPALAAGVVEVRGGELAFSHPLFATAVYAGASAGSRRASHARLALRAATSEEHARHLALAVEGPDETAAAAVAAAGEEALRRGATAAAVELLERAVLLTPSRGAALAERVLGAAEANRRAGNEDGGRRLARRVLHELPPGRSRTRLLIWLADAEGTIAAADAAVAAAGGDDELVAAALNARCEARQVGDDVDGALRDARAAVAAARRASSSAVLVRALAHVGHLETMAGDARGIQKLEEAASLQDPHDPATVLHGPATSLAIVALWRDDLDRARPALRSQITRAAELGDERARAAILQRLARAELWAGDLETALLLADELVELKEGDGWDDPVAGLWVRALVHAQLGRIEDARADVDRARALAAAQNDPDHFQVVFADGFTWGADGRHDRAADVLGRLPGFLAAAGVREPGVCPFHADELEALVRSGRAEQAAERIAAVEEEGARLDRPRLLLAAARGRGLLAETQGRADDALVAFECAVAASERLPIPFERGRALLDLGTALRRVRRRSEARDALAAARDRFSALPAPIWAGRATAELARLGGRTADGELTATERRVADLAAAGRSTKAIAAELVVSAKTVEKHLTSIYAKLGVRSRAELAARAAEG